MSPTRPHCISPGTGEVDLDALLEDLCVMERDINSASAADTDDKAEDMDHVQIKSPISPTAKVGAARCCVNRQPALYLIYR